MTKLYLTQKKIMQQQNSVSVSLTRAALICIHKYFSTQSYIIFKVKVYQKIRKWKINEKWEIENKSKISLKIAKLAKFFLVGAA